MNIINSADYPGINPAAIAAVNRLNENLIYVKSKVFTCKVAIEHDVVLAQRALIEAGEVLLTNQKEILFLMREGYGDLASTFNAITLQYKGMHAQMLDILDRAVSLAIQTQAQQTYACH